ncbi:hypothetical protein N7462_001640 [Penicillium macrosclerotiorum]|uniref:uncharacterized protein n=1 Tax=Penicillium macrosclerotiorum TaxID=303699 RepID=UPI00254965B6|nr:uncharacterized protein N7462_001640 [Penicillium macrosclerotiorum]KAJ5692217.1 hypothetical protein N7462_001640 [Penicillium macrosclerotiorum]
MDKIPAKTGMAAWTAKKKIFVSLIIGFIIIAIGVGLGVGLGIGLKNHGGGGEDEGSGGNTTTGGNTTVKWQPEVGVKWQIELLYALNDTSVDAHIYDIDMFDNDKDMISKLQGMGRKVICYFSAGTYESWRSDAGDFAKSDLGNNLDDWPGERWLDTNSDNVRKIMKTRLDLAQTKGCDGVDPDNIDAYDNSNGLKLTEDDAINYVNWLASQAHSRGLSLGLKNGGDIIDSVISNMQWSVNEQCAQYKECDTYSAFIDANKPVFHIEYPKGDDTNNNNAVTTTQRSSACNAASSGNFSTVIKNMDLDNWVEYCG